MRPRPTRNAEMTMTWTLCSPHFDDTVIIHPDNINEISISDNYEHIPSKISREPMLSIVNMAK